LDRLEELIKKVIATMGVFDGVHRAHLHLFQPVIRRAKKVGGVAVVYTFEPHPAKVLVPEACPQMIMTPAQKREAILKSGISRLVIQRFTRRFSKLSPEQFFKKIILKKLKADELWIGYDFTFGYHRSGTIETLEALGKKWNVHVKVMEPFLWKETLVSSTQIRQLLARGHVKQARDLAGRSYRMTGRVIRGRGIGNLLGIHTANLKTANDLILPTGVYATETWLKGRPYPSVTNIGPNPTFGPAPVTIETHLLNFSRPIVGLMIDIEFIEKIREELTFASAEDLANQIRNDIQVAKRYFR
jgi:riboflavin kinase/FMN adenylyltransferase